MILSLTTGAIAIVNSASFVFLAPGNALVSYLACSAIYSFAVWINLWIIPSAWRYQQDSLHRIRMGQIVVVAVGASALMASHPNGVGAGFATLLLLDTAIFYSFPLLFQSNTILSQRIDFTRTCLSALCLLALLFTPGRSPTVYIWMLVGVTVLMAVALFLTGWHKSPTPYWRNAEMREIANDLVRSLSSPQLQATMAARVVEIIILSVLAWSNMLGMLICFKLGLAVCNALVSNARRYAARFLVVMAIGLYGAGLTVAIVAVSYLPALVPKALHYVTAASAAVMLLPVLLYFWLMLQGLRANTVVEHAVDN